MSKAYWISPGVNGGAFPPKDGEYTFLKNKAA